MAGNKKYKIKPVPVIISAVVVIGLIAGLAMFSLKNSKEEQQSNVASVSVSQKNLKNDVEINTEPVKAATTVEIQLQDSAVVIGTVFKVSAIVTPPDTELALVWSSSNENILSVDNDGVVTVKTTGTAALTATVGTVSDSVIIQGIDNAIAGSDRGLALYTGDTYTATSSTDSTSSNTTNNANVNNSNAQTGNTNSENVPSSNNNSNSGNNNSGEDISQNDNNSNIDNSSDINNNTNTDNSSNNSANVPNDNQIGYDNSSDSGTHSGVTSGEIAGYLPGLGFSQRMSNVYVCEENGTYYGEIITQPSVTIVYIKQRSATFDSMIQSTLSTLLPTGGTQVWNNYVSSSSDRTFTVDGRRVRIVTALNGGHSQIVIYN